MCVLTTRWSCSALSLLTLLALTGDVRAAPWQEDPGFSQLESGGAGSCKVDAADLNGDGFIDLVFANTAGTTMGSQASARPQQAYFNDGAGGFVDVSEAVFGGQSLAGRAVKLRDIEGDGDIDIVLGTVWISQSQLLINDGLGNFTNETEVALPLRPASVGDIEVGDVDQDGALDLVLTNWGEDPRQDDVVNGNAAGGVTLLWKQVAQGSAVFEDATAVSMPVDELRMAWDLEFVDFNNDYALDLLVVCKYCAAAQSLWLLRNDGQGNFTKSANISSPNELFADGNDVEVMDLDGDSFLDAVVLHDGLNARNRVLRNNAGAGFLVADSLWPAAVNPKSQDYMAAFHDHDADGDPDLVVGALRTADMANPSPDRLMLLEGGVFAPWGATNQPPFQALGESVPSSGTCAIVLADFNGDHKLDVAMGQFDNAFEKYVYFATDEVAVDTAPPILVNYEKPADVLNFPEDIDVRLRAHDNKSPLMLHDFASDGWPYIEHWDAEPNPDPEAIPGIRVLGTWYGEYLWRIWLPAPDADEFFYRYCAIDAAGNKACTPVEKSIIISGGGHDSYDDEGYDDDDSYDDDGYGDESITLTLEFTDTEAMTSQPLPTSGDLPTSDLPTSGGEPAGSSGEATGGQQDGDGMEVGCACRSEPGGAAGALLGLGALLGRRRRRS